MKIIILYIYIEQIFFKLIKDKIDKKNILILVNIVDNIILMIYYKYIKFLN